MGSHYRMYDDLVDYWPLLSSPEDYKSESSCWNQALREKLGPGKHPILEFGIGAGDNLSHFAAEFKVTGVDLSEKMLELSRQKNPTVEHIVGDMRSIRLKRKFKAVIIHDAISYLTSERDLLDTFVAAAAHLEPGGIFITAPEWYKETHKKGAAYHITRRRNGLELTFIQYDTYPIPDDTLLQCLMLYLISEKGKIRVEQDLQQTGIFPLSVWEILLADAGFSLEKRPYPIYADGRESFLLIGTLKQAAKSTRVD